MPQRLAKRKIGFIMNPFSGTKNKKKVLQLVNSSFDKAIYDISIHRTCHSKHAIEISKTLVDQGYDTVVAIGGDGTINEVASSLKGSNTALGVISMGSGNGFARHMNLHHNVKKSLEIIKDGQRQLIDTCTINGVPFVNVAGIGYDAKVAFKTKKNKLRGIWQYLFTSIKYARRIEQLDTILYTDNQCIESHFMSVVVANGSLYGFNFKVAPDASVIDGVMDVLLVKQVSLWQYIKALPYFATGQIDKVPFTTLLKTKILKIEIAANQNIKYYYHVDGEGYKTKTKSHLFEIFPQSLVVITPR